MQVMPPHDKFDMRFLRAGGEMGRRIAAFDWGTTPLGPIEKWPVPLLSSIKVMLLTRIPMYIAWGPELTLIYNDQYAATIPEKHPGALGRSLRGLWDKDSWRIIAPEIEAALSGHPSFVKDRPHPLGSRGRPAKSYFTYCSVPLSDESGQVKGVFCSGYETTADVRTRDAYRADSERLRDLFDQAPGFMVVLRGPEHTFEIVNEAYYGLVGHREMIGKPVRVALPEIEGQGYYELLDIVYATGKPHVAVEAPVRLRRTPDGPQEERLVSFVYQPIRDALGEVSGIFIQGNDVTDAVRATSLQRETERLARSTMDALAEHIAVIDEHGTILAVNEAWRAFAKGNGAIPATSSEGANYLAACDHAAEQGDPVAQEVAALIRQVAAGACSTAEIDYPCNTPAQKLWFHLKITRFRDQGPTRIVMAHENITTRRENEERIEYLATHDALTGLPNRSLLEDRAMQAIQHSNKTGLGLALVVLDLDNFKNVNDAYGHSVGDEVLVAVTKEVNAVVGAGDTIARLGGDELVVLLPNLANAVLEADRTAQAITTRLSSSLQLDTRDLTVTASIGISVYPNDGHTFHELLKNADVALSRAKAAGRSGHQFYTAEMSDQASKRVKVENALRRALARNQFTIVYQPKVAMRDGTTIGLEALIRWTHPELGNVPPISFIPVAEEAGLIGSIGRFVMKTACGQARAWQRIGLPAVPISVNVSAAQLSHPDFVDTVADVLSETGLDPSFLDLEITEGIMMESAEALITRLRALRDVGVELTIDDFGTGYSNLAYLKAFPLNRLKIDRSFVWELTRDPNANAIARAVIAMGNSLGLKVIAEGVETSEQAKILIEMGCEEGQGYFYSRPLRPNDVIGWFKG